MTSSSDDHMRIAYLMDAVADTVYALKEVTTLLKKYVHTHPPFIFGQDAGV